MECMDKLKVVMAVETFLNCCRYTLSEFSVLISWPDLVLINHTNNGTLNFY